MNLRFPAAAGLFAALFVNLALIGCQEENPLASSPDDLEEPSYRVGVFYYPWYETPEVDGHWGHWEGGTRYQPPLDIDSDYYPVLGAYSSVDTSVIAQHFKWLRKARVGVIMCSWWGQGDYTDRTIPTLLKVAVRYKIKVSFLLEPYGGRGANELVADIKYLYSSYGNHPAFYRTNTASRWSPDDRSKGLFFMWGGIGLEPGETPAAEDPGYWQAAIDTIHALPGGALVFYDVTDATFIDKGHFDGLYNYATLDINPDFSWAHSLPSDALYVPSVLPGFLVRRNAGPGEQPVILPRNGGTTYQTQWQAALQTGVQPLMITITTFNEWHEGTQIEPAAKNAANGRGFTYEDYDSLPTDGYLSLTRPEVEKLERLWPEK